MPSISATGVRLRRSVQSPTAQTPGALVRLRSSTATAPPLSSTAASPLLQLHPDAASRRAPFQAQRAGLGVQVDPTLREVLRDALPQLAVEAPQRQVPAVDQVHLRTESGE